MNIFRPLISSYFGYLALFHSEALGAKKYDLPVFPTHFPTDLTLVDGEKLANSSRYLIPRNVWIAVRNKSDERPRHIAPFVSSNPKWMIHFYGNQDKDNFMSTYYANTSLLWAYDMLNPLIGCSRPELWRLAALYAYGGVYLDDDATIGSPLDDVILPTDQLILGKEPYDFDDRCFADNYPLSNHSFNKRFGLAANTPNLLGGKFFFNWALFSSPRHPILRRAMEYMVDLIRREYISESAIKMRHSDHRGKLLMCATTFPITHSAREMILELSFVEKNITLALQKLGLRIGGKYFEEYGARMKAWYNDMAPSHWVKVIHKLKAPYLRQYAPPLPEKFEGVLLQSPGNREIYLINNGTRRGFPDWPTFVAMRFDINQVRQVPRAVLDLFPLGMSLPTKSKRDE